MHFVGCCAADGVRPGLGGHRGGGQNGAQTQAGPAGSSLIFQSGVVPARCDTGSPWTFLPPLPGAGYPTRNWQIVRSRVISGISSGCVGASRVWLGQRNGTPIDAIGQLYFLTFTRDFKALRLS